MAGGVNIPVGSTWNNKGVKQAQQDLGHFQKQAKGFTSTISKSFLGLGAGIGAGLGLSALVGQLGDMATAAAQDERSVVALGVALRNSGLGGSVSQAEDFVRSLMLATGVADDELRPALQSLVTATGDITKAQDSLSLALDISAGTGRDLQSVSLALAKGWSGSTTALGRLGAGIDKATIASGDMARITDQLRSKFAGQASAAANTYAGKMKRLSTAASEAQETVGYALLGAVDSLSASLGGTDGAVSGITELGQGLADVITGGAEVVRTLEEIARAAGDIAGAGGDDGFGLSDLVGLGYALNPVTGPIKQIVGDLQGMGEEARRVQEGEAGWVDYRKSIESLGTTLPPVTSEIDGATASLIKQRTAAERLKGALDDLYGGNQSRVQDRIALKRLGMEGPDKSGQRKDGKKTVEFATADDARLWAVDYAQQAAQYAGDFTSKRKQAGILSDARAYIASQVGQYGVNKPKAFANSLVGAPEYLTNPRPWEARYGAQGRAEGVTNIVIQTLTVESGAALDQIKKEAARLAAASGGRYSTTNMNPSR